MGGGGRTLLGFLVRCNISKRFCLQWKAFDLLYKMGYILWVVALLEAVTSPNMVSILDFIKHTPPPPTPVSPRVEIKPIVERPPAGAPS